MTNLSHCARSDAFPAGGSPLSKSTPVEIPTEEDGVKGYMFGDMLSAVAQDPETNEADTTDSASHDRPVEACDVTCLLPAELSKQISHFDLSLPASSSADAGPELLCSTSTGRQAHPGQQTDLRISSDDTASLWRLTTINSDSTAFMPFTPKPKDETPKIATSSTTLFDGVALPMADSGRLEPRLGIQQSSPHFSMADKRMADESINSADGDQAPVVVARPSDVDSGVSSEAISKTGAPPTSAPPVAVPIHITELATHLPPMILRAAANLAAPSRDGAAMTGAQPATSVQPEATPVKILTFDLHPAALGPLTVRMRLSGKQVDIAIDVRSDDVRAILTQTRGAMVEALAEHGLTLERPDIRLTILPPPPLASGDSGTAMNEQNAHANPGSFGQDQGQAPHDERSAHTRRLSQIDEQSQKARGGPVDADKRAGIYL